MILEIITLTIFIATIFNILLNRFRIPTIIWYIVTGTIISNIYWLQEISWNHDLKLIAEFWVVFLMFSIGLSFSIKDLLKMKKNVFLYWSLQFFITSLLFYFLSIFIFWLSIVESIIISLWFSLSSTAIVLKTLKETWDINKHYWRLSLWILLFQDLMVIPIMLLVTILSTNIIALPILLTKTIISALVLFLVLFLIWRYLLDWFFYKVAKTKSNEIFIWSILFIIIGSSILAYYLWFPYSLWAFIAWILISETHYKHQVEADLIPFRDLLLWFFFVTVWMQLKLSIIFDNIYIILLLLIVLFIIKIFVIYFMLICFNNKKISLKTALSLFQFWEFTIVVFELATINNLLKVDTSHILIVVIIISMLITPFILRKLWVITEFIFWNKHIDNDDLLLSEKLEWHIVLIWYWRLWKIISKLLVKHKINYLIIENDINTYKKAKKELIPIIFWNAFQANTLKSINIENAESVIISVWRSEKLYLIAKVVKKLNIQWNIVVKVNNFSEESMLKDLNIKNIIVESEKTALAMFNKIKYKK